MSFLSWDSWLTDTIFLFKGDILIYNIISHFSGYLFLRKLPDTHFIFKITSASFNRMETVVHWCFNSILFRYQLINFFQMIDKNNLLTSSTQSCGEVHITVSLCKVPLNFLYAFTHSLQFLLWCATQIDHCPSHLSETLLHVSKYF